MDISIGRRRICHCFLASHSIIVGEEGKADNQGDEALRDRSFELLCRSFSDLQVPKSEEAQTAGFGELGSRGAGEPGQLR